MIPHERSLVEELKNEPFALIGINSDTDMVDYRRQQADAGLTWRSFWNGPLGTGGPIAATWNVTGWPTIYVLDHKGVIRFKNVRGEKMTAAVRQLLDELAAGK
jgi:hypothetical protein